MKKYISRQLVSFCMLIGIIFFTSEMPVFAVGGTDCSLLPAYPAGRGTYKAGDRVQNNNEIYECKAWPFDGWANSTNSAYAPGVGFAWQDAWIDIGPCTGSNIAPTASITSPANNSSFATGSNINISANASDADGTITQVQFYQGTTLLGTDNTSPYSYAWNNVAQGSYSLTAVATDNAGAKTTSAAVSVIVSSANLSPTVSITAPANNSSFATGSNISISATASDADGTITQVQFYQGTTLLGTDNTSPYSYAWNSVAQGSYSLTAVATDNAGAKTTSAAIAITVSTANVLPTVSIISPANNSSFTSGSNLTINATAADADGTIAQVQFYQGSTLLGSDDTSPYSFAWSNLPVGSFSITAKATDNKGASTTSTAIAITVTGGGGDCGGLPVYPAGRGNYKPGDKVSSNNQIYECKAWPFDGWANSTSPAYVPGTGTNWQDAWTLIGPCGGNTAPTAPSNLNATALSKSSISIGWTDNSANETAFRLERSADGNTWTLLISLAANTTSYTHSGLTASTKYYYRLRAENTYGNSAYTGVVNATTLPDDGNGNTDLGARLLVGYWHNFSNGTVDIKLRDISDKWDVINVAFAETEADRSTLKFAPYNATESEFKADIAYLHSKGKKLVLSVGGQNGVLIVSDNTARDRFISTAIALISNYGFDGIDLDLENNVTVNAGESLDNPTNPQIINLISATRDICNHFGAKFILSMAPEIAYVQGGITAYGGPWGGYLPIIHKLRDKLTYLHVQHYNCGGNTGLDGRTYNQGTADFEVAMAEMLMKGFPIAGNSNNMFPALRQDQVMIGLPAAAGAAPSGGYISPTELKKALDYIIKGTSFGGTYVLQNSGGYYNFRGLMSWSVNWDAFKGNEFATNYRAYFDALPKTKSARVLTSVLGAENGGVKLSQNYPNPFSTSSNISYMTNEAGFVSLRVYNVVGEEVKVLVNQFQTAGDYKLTLNASDLGVGAYYYQLKVGNTTMVKKMMITK